MGFFKKIFKGIKKVFKKIGKGIKSAFKKVGKFMGKIGIIGQIGLALILPGVGQMLSGLLVGTGSTVGGLAGALQGMGAVGQAASSFIQGAVKVAGRVGNFFSSVTDGVTKVVGDTIGAAAQNLGITADSALGQGLSKFGINMDVDGWGGVFTNAQESLSSIGQAGKNIFSVDPLQEISVPQRALKEIPQDSLLNEAPLREAIDSEGALNALTQDRLQTEAAMARVGGEPLLGGDPFGPVGTIDGVTYMKGPPPQSLLSPAQATTAPTTTGKPVYVAPETFTEKVMAKGQELYSEGVKLAQEEIAQAPARLVQAGTTKVMQAVGLEDVPEYQYNQYAIAVPAIDMGSTTGIGEAFNTGQAQEYYKAYSSDLQSKPYGDLSSLYAYFDFMRQRGYA